MGFFIQVIISNLLTKFILIRFTKRKIKQKKTKRYSYIYSILLSGWVFNLAAFLAFKHADIGLIIIAILSIIIDIAVIQWFRAFWEKDENTPDLDYGHTSIQ